jgi:hypothetical protein
MRLVIKKQTSNHQMAWNIKNGNIECQELPCILRGLYAVRNQFNKDPVPILS